MSRTKSAIKNLSFALVGQVLGLIISFIARIIFIKFLNSEYLGLNGLFSNILSMLSLAELGVGTAITYSLYKPLAEKDNDKCAMLMQLYKKIYTFIGLLIFILGVLITPLLPYLIVDMPDIKEIYLVYVLFVTNTSISYFFSYKRNLIIADQHRYIATLYRYSFYCLYNVCQIVYLVLFRDYIGFLVIQILSTFFENVFISIKADKMYPFLKDSKKHKLDKKTKKEIIKNTKAMMMHKIGGVVVNSTDNLLISKMIGLVTVGIYSNYLLITTALNTVLGQVYNSLTASVGNMVVTNSKEKHFIVYKKIEFLTYWIYSFASVCLICLFNPFITVWIGKEFLFSFEIVLVLTLNFYITGMRKTNLTFREASGLFEKDKWKPIAESIINLVSSILLALKFGVIGVFLGTLISSVTTCLWVEPYVIYKYDFKRPFKEYIFTYIKRFLLFIFMAGITYTICYFISFTGFIKVIVNLVIALIIPNVILFVVYHKSEEFNYFKILVGKIANKVFRVLKKIFKKLHLVK